jgi:hypothetical protein
MWLKGEQSPEVVNVQVREFVRDAFDLGGLDVACRVVAILGAMLAATSAPEGLTARLREQQLV